MPRLDWRPFKLQPCKVNGWIGFARGHEKAALRYGGGFGKSFMASSLCLFDEAGLDGLYADPHALDLTRGEANLDALQVGTELAFRRFRYVRADTAALLALTLAVDDAAGGRTLACNCANSCHVGN